MTATDRLGTLDQLDGEWQLRFRRRLAHPPERVWRAVTEPEQLAAWFPSTIDGDRVAGAELRFTFPFPDAPVMEGEMLVYDPPRTLAFRWGEDVVSIELAPDGDGCVLELVDTLGDLGKAGRDGAGWHVCLDGLERHLAGAEASAADDSWQSLSPVYRERFGPEASTTPPPDWVDLPAAR